MHDAKLVWATPDLERHLLEIARVSNPEGQKQWSPGLLSYLIREKHWSPFEMVNICMEADTTRDIGRHLLRHALRPQEFSQRYADPRQLAPMAFTEARLQDPKNRQNSIETSDPDLQVWWTDAQQQVANLANKLYGQALEKNIAKELARKILPEGMTPTRLYFNGNLRDWLFMVNLRSGNGTQREAIRVAESMKAVLWKQAPLTCEAFFGGNL